MDRITNVCVGLLNIVCQVDVCWQAKKVNGRPSHDTLRLVKHTCLHLLLEVFEGAGRDVAHLDLDVDHGCDLQSAKRLLVAVL